MNPTNFAAQIRKIILEQSKRAHVGHIGSSLSIADIVGTLYSGVMRYPGPNDPDRDLLVLSKGHAVLAVYAALHLRGILSSADLNTYCAPSTHLGVHPERGLPGIEVSTGSLGQGLSVAAGMALGARLKKSGQNVYVVMSDAEMNEGSVWEAIMFAAHHRLSNLAVIVDDNGQQALDYTRNVLNLGSLKEKWSTFGWCASEVDGHDSEAIASALAGMGSPNSKPRVVIAKTVFGKGVSYMEGSIPWHYLPMNDEQYATAMNELEARRG